MQNKLKFLLECHEKLAFPMTPNSAELTDWISDLVEIDPYYVGTIKSLLGGDRSIKIDKSHIIELQEKIKKIAVDGERDKVIFLQCIEYMKSLLSIIELTQLKR